MIDVPVSSFIVFFFGFCSSFSPSSPDSVDSQGPTSRRIAPPVDKPKRSPWGGSGEGERGERGGEVADGGSGQAGVGERREGGDTDSPVDCTPAMDVLDMTGLPNRRMLDIEDGMFLFSPIPFANGCAFVFVRHAFISTGAAQCCCSSTRGIEAGRVGVYVVAAQGVGLGLRHWSRRDCGRYVCQLHSGSIFSLSSCQINRCRDMQRR